MKPKLLAQLRQQLQECAAGTGGEVSARNRAAKLGETYLGLDDAGRHEFLRRIALDFGPEPAKVDAAHRAYQSAAGTPRQWDAEADLRAALRSSRIRILTQFNALPQGVKFLVDLRTDLLRFLEKDEELAVLDRELESRLTAWFDVGFLELQRITWNSPASLLEKLIQYEAVHEIRSWSDLRNRLDSDRRLYAFFHPRMPQEPLIFVEVALTKELSSNIQELLDEHAPVFDPARADTAIFYSISNTQPGLRGVSFGNFLLKRVIDDLKRDYPAAEDLRHALAAAAVRRLAEAHAGGTRGPRPDARPAPVGRVGAGQGAGAPPARSARATRRPLPVCGAPERPPLRPGGALPPRQRRPHRAHQFPGGHFGQGLQAVLRPDGELFVRSGRDRAERRSFRRRGPDCRHRGDPQTRQNPITTGGDTMNARRRILAASLAAASLALFGPQAFAQTPKVLKISHQFPGGSIDEGDFRDRMVRKFAAEVEKRTNGQLKFEIYPGGSLVKPVEQWGAMANGSLDMSLYPLAYAGGRVPELNIGLMPALVTSYEQGLRWKDAPIGKELTRIVEEKGVKIVTWVWQAGGIASRGKPILQPDDVKGLKFRGGSKEMDMMLKAAGASPTNVPSSEIYNAMQSGVLDAALTSSTSLISFRLHEHAKHVTTARDKTFWFMFEPIMMSKASFDKLTPEQQNIVMEVGASLEKFGMESARADDQKLASVYTQAGDAVHDMNEAAFAKWRDIARASAWKDFEEKIPNGRKLLEMAVAVK